MTDHTPLLMPKLGLTMTEGLLAKWLVGPGDQVSAGQTLFLVETDKIASDVDAPADGKIISIAVQEGDTVPVGGIVGFWTGTALAEQPASQANPGAGSGSGAAEPAEPTSSGPSVSAMQPRRAASPFARRMASIEGLDLSQVIGTGDRGRAKARDVIAAISRRNAAAAPPAAPAPAASPAGGPGTPPSSANFRRAIAARLARSKGPIPHFYVSAQADIHALDAYRSELNGDTRHARLTMTPFLVAAVGRALAHRPAVNMLWRDGGPLPLAGIAVGLAVDTDSGVRIPVIADADLLSIDEIAAAITDAADRARGRRLHREHVRQAAISVSNVGMFGVAALTPIIDPDQSHILGVGAPQSLFRPAADGAAAAAREITLTLACDHRLIDGATGAEFLRAVVGMIEAPRQLPRKTVA
jgi:pyruvate dehydrogenase E2 component (dihydrolipoamide acetyltransferase)